MTDNVAVLAGFTREIIAEGGCYELHLMVRPEAYLDGTFCAWCCDDQEFINVNGWNFIIEDID